MLSLLQVMVSCFLLVSNRFIKMPCVLVSKTYGLLKKNQLWTLDGTPHDEIVRIKYRDGRSKRYQSVYQVSAYNQATYKHLGIAIAPQKIRQDDRDNTESFEVVLSALKMAIRKSGYKPAVLQTDQGPAFLS